MISWLRALFAGQPLWEYGVCRERIARRHRATGAVQFVLWKAGEQGHVVDYWHDFNPYWWPQFVSCRKK